jgi:single stranded DNA-binding protein
MTKALGTDAGCRQLARCSVPESGAKEETMLSVNKVILMGVLADEPVIQPIEGSRTMIGLSVFTMRRWSESTDGQQESKEWHRVVITDPGLAAYAETHLRQHDQIYIEGELHTMFWRDETFDWQSLTKIVLWQDGHRLRRVSDDDCVEAKGMPEMLKAAQDARMFDALGHVA